MCNILQTWKKKLHGGPIHEMVTIHFAKIINGRERFVDF
jgi:hypothetical protein